MPRMDHYKTGFTATGCLCRPALLFHLRQSREKQNPDPCDRHQVGIHAEAADPQLGIVVGRHHRTHAQEGVIPESQGDHPHDQQVLDQHHDRPEIAEISDAQILRISEHKVDTGRREDHQRKIHPRSAALRDLAQKGPAALLQDREINDREQKIVSDQDNGPQGVQPDR